MASFVEVMEQKERMCKASYCMGCNLSSQNNGFGEACEYVIVKHYVEAEKIIMDWAKKHPVMTNADKVREVLGLSKDDFDPHECWGMECPSSEDDACRICPRKDFWAQEWKEPKEKANDKSL